MAVIVSTSLSPDLSHLEDPHSDLDPARLNDLSGCRMFASKLAHSVPTDRLSTWHSVLRHVVLFLTTEKPPLGMKTTTTCSSTLGAVSQLGSRYSK